MDNSKNLDNIYQAIRFAYSSFPSIQFQLEIQLFCLWIDILERLFFSSLMNKQLGCHAWKGGWSMVYCPCTLVSKSIILLCHWINGILLASSKFGQRQLVINEELAGGIEPIRFFEIFWRNNNIVLSFDHRVCFFNDYLRGVKRSAIFMQDRSQEGEKRGFIYARAEYYLACENIRFSLLFTAGDILHGGTSATERQKFHTDDVKYVQNPVRSPDWSTE